MYQKQELHPQRHCRKVGIQGSLHQVVEKAHTPPKAKNISCLGGELHWPKEEWSWSCSKSKPCPRPDVSPGVTRSMPRASGEPGRSQSDQKAALRESLGPLTRERWAGGRECWRKPGKWGCLEGKNTEIISPTPLFPIFLVQNGSNRCVMPWKLFLE